MGRLFRTSTTQHARRYRIARCGVVSLCALGVLLSLGPETATADTTLETDTEALAQVFFALGGPGWQNRRGWQLLEDARAQFDDVFDMDGDEVLTLEELKQGMNVNYVGCRFPPCYPTLKVHNPLFRIPEPENRFRLQEFGWFDDEISALVQRALRQRLDPVRGIDKVEGRDKSIDNMLLFKEFFSNFIQSDPCLDEWFGLSCSDQGRVLAISLPANQLTGTIPPDIGNFTALRGLHLGGFGGGGLDSNNINGEIPEAIVQLYQLESLSLDHNLLSGTIPKGIGQLTRLTSIHLSHNRFFGPIPDLSQLTGLEELMLDHNRLQGPIDTVGNLTNLQKLDVSYNEFTGDIQKPLVALPRLRHVYFHANPFADKSTTLSPLGANQRVPPSLASDVGRLSAAVLPLDKAVLLDLYTALAGRSWHIRRGWDEEQSDPCLSSWFGVTCDDHGRVIAIELSRNNLTGVLPRSIGQLKMLKSLRLSHNALRGALPQEVSHLRYLRTLHLADNLLSSSFPPAIGTLNEIEDLVLTNNYFVGSIPSPTSPGGLARLRRLELAGNRFHGPLPPTLRLLLGLDLLDVTGNRLSGHLPPGYGELLSLRGMLLGSNALEGPLPEQWSALGRLRVLDASGNRLAGVLPESWGSDLVSLQRLSLDGNRIEGRLPASIFRLPQLQVLGLHGNRLSGSLPEALVQANVSLEVLDLGSNTLGGMLPAALALLPNLAALDLSGNRFQGFLPDYLESNDLLRELKNRHQLQLGGNDFACPLPPWAPHDAVCTTRNCPLHHVSDGRVCVPCRPGYFRDAHTSLCSRCRSSVTVADDADAGTVTDRACAVYSQDLPNANALGNGADTRGGSVGGEGSNPTVDSQRQDVGLQPRASAVFDSSAYAIKCMPCRQALRLRLKVVPEEDAWAMRQHAATEDEPGGSLVSFDTSVYSTSDAMYEMPQDLRRSSYGELRWNASSAYPDGAKYNGEILDGAPHGRGALVTKYGIYIGEFVRGKRQGKGEFTSTAGDSMSGDWGDFGEFFPGTGTNWGGVLNGMGVAKYRANARVALRALATGAVTAAQVGSAGGTYEGDWKDGEWHGKGAFSAANGDVYLGEFFRGKFHGLGVHHLHDGAFYKGGWFMGKKHGNGTLYYANGDLYEGGWKDDLRSGWGILWYWDGTVYEGYWEMGLKQGWGRETVERTGQVFEGRFRSGYKHGHGVMHYGNGDAYHGQYVDGMRHGDGIMHYADALFSDVGFTIRAGFMFDEPRVSARMTRVDDDTTITRPQDGDGDPDDNLQYWGQINTNYLVGDGYQGGGR